MQFEFTEPQTVFEQVFGGHFVINAMGPIEANDGVKFRDFLEAVAPPPRTEVYINSTGGDVDAAIEIGRLVRGGWCSTSIGSYVLNYDEPTDIFHPRKMITGQCMSAATLVCLGGRLRYFPKESKFGVHQFSFLDPTPDDVGRSQALSARIASYVADMGIKTKFLEVSADTPGSDIRHLGEDELQQLGVVTGHQTEVEWSVQARGEMLYVRGERDSLFGHHKVMLCYSKGVGFLFWAVIEAQGREEELTTLGLVEIVVNGEEVRIDITDRCERHVHGIYVNLVSKILEDEARLLAFSDSFGVQIRGSHQAGTFLGMSAMTTEGGAL